jgi:hypothetical protein
MYACAKQVVQPARKRPIAVLVASTPVVFFFAIRKDLKARMLVERAGRGSNQRSGLREFTPERVDLVTRDLQESAL